MQKRFLTTAVLLLTAAAFAQNQPAAIEPPPPQPAADPAPVPAPRRVRAADQLQQAEYQRAVAEANFAAAHAFAPYKQKMEKAAYIGIASSPMPAVLREQLKLDKGVGLVVDRVEPESPAEAAGIKAYDVIQKLDDQVLINPHQFGILVRTLKPEQEVKLSIIREAKPQTITVKPIEKELAVIEEAAAYGTPTVWTTAKPMNAGQYTRTVRAAGGNNPFTLDRTEMVTDNNKTITTTTIGPAGERKLNVVDKLTGKLIFDGAIDTDEQRKALPKEVAEQLNAIEEVKIAKPTLRLMTPRTAVNQWEVKLPRAGNALPKPRVVSGSDDDYTWEFTLKAVENGKSELELLLLDKNGTILFQGPFSRTRDMNRLPKTVSVRLSTSPWDILIEDLKSAGVGGFGAAGFGGAINIDVAPALPPQPDPQPRGR